jgi:hypothetical protein
VFAKAFPYLTCYLGFNEKWEGGEVESSANEGYTYFIILYSTSQGAFTMGAAYGSDEAKRNTCRNLVGKFLESLPAEDQVRHGKT